MSYLETTTRSPKLKPKYATKRLVKSSASKKFQAEFSEDIRCTLIALVTPFCIKLEPESGKIGLRDLASVFKKFWESREFLQIQNNSVDNSETSQKIFVLTTVKKLLDSFRFFNCGWNP